MIHHVRPEVRTYGFMPPVTWWTVYDETGKSVHMIDDYERVLASTDRAEAERWAEHLTTQGATT